MPVALINCLRCVLESNRLDKVAFVGSDPNPHRSNKVTTRSEKIGRGATSQPLRVQFNPPLDNVVPTCVKSLRGWQGEARTVLTVGGLNHHTTC
jgi:hypothetical protein